jgi:hypothetical protein
LTLPVVSGLVSYFAGGGTMSATRLIWTALVSSLCIGPLPVEAQAPTGAATQDPTPVEALRAEIAQLRKDFEARLSALEARLSSAGGAPSAVLGSPTQPTAQVPAGAEGAGGPSGSLPVYGNAYAASKIFNPDVAVIGNFIGIGGKNSVRPEPGLAMREAEASFQAIVDPYARADFFMAFGEEGVDLEEGYLTFPTLPGGVLMKVGKLRAAFGRVNTFHTHQLPWPDRPLVTENLVGGEEGISDAGVSVARLIPNRWMFLEATGQVFRGDSGDVFASQRRRNVSVIGRLRGYQDITESTNIDLGGSYARGHNPSGALAADPGRYTTTLFGVDATFRWRPLQRSIYRSFIARSELIWNRREQPGGRQAGAGFYVSGDYQLARRWFVGARLDGSDRADEAALRDTGRSAFLTFWPSEFSQVRGQYRRTKYAEGPTANEFLVQFQFSIGAHGAHPF